MRGGERDGLRRCGNLRQRDPKAGVLENLSGSAREITREEAAIESDHQRVAIDVGGRLKSARRDGDRFAYAANVLECKGVGDDGTPSVSTERDVGHAATLLTKDAA